MLILLHYQVVCRQLLGLSKTLPDWLNAGVLSFFCPCRVAGERRRRRRNYRELVVEVKIAKTKKNFWKNSIAVVVVDCFVVAVVVVVVVAAADRHRFH